MAAFDEKHIKEERTELFALRSLVEVYGEIASIRMRKIRGYVLQNRSFIEAINSIFKDALASYANKLANLVKKGKIKKGGRVTFLSHNGRTVAVLISANTGFYGEVIQDTFKMFLKEVREKDLEVTIIGKLGLSLYLSKEPSRPYTYFDLPDYGVDEAKLDQTIRHLVQYEELHVFYGKYVSVVSQKPTMYDISSGTSVSDKVVKPGTEYIFEPSVEKILMFFETQIFASLFEQSLRESQLAKFASRIMAMDEAGENIRKRIREVDLEGLRLGHKIANRKQLNSLASIFINK